MPNDTSDALEGVSTAYSSLLDADACTNSSVYADTTGTPLSSIDIDEFISEIESGIASLSADTLDDLADRVSHPIEVFFYSDFTCVEKRCESIGCYTLSTLFRAVAVDIAVIPLMRPNVSPLTACSCKVEGVSEAVETTRGIRKGLVWPVISLTMLLIIVFLVIALGTYNIMACSLSKCVSIANCITPCAVFLAIIIWLSAASAVTMSGKQPPRPPKS